MLLVGILVPLAAMFCCIILISICCYKKREWYDFIHVFFIS